MLSFYTGSYHNCSPCAVTFFFQLPAVAAATTVGSPLTFLSSFFFCHLLAIIDLPLAFLSLFTAVASRLPGRPSVTVALSRVHPLVYSVSHIITVPYFSTHQSSCSRSRWQPYTAALNPADSSLQRNTI